MIFETGSEDARFFFVLHPSRARWIEIVAFDADGRELDRVTRQLSFPFGEDLPESLAV
jgi:hypothetical protein